MVAMVASVRAVILGTGYRGTGQATSALGAGVGRHGAGVATGRAGSRRGALGEGWAWGSPQAWKQRGVSAVRSGVAVGHFKRKYLGD